MHSLPCPAFNSIPLKHFTVNLPNLGAVGALGGIIICSGWEVGGGGALGGGADWPGPAGLGGGPEGGGPLWEDLKKWYKIK